MYGSSSDPQPPHGQYGAYYIGDLVARTIGHGLSLGPEDAVEAKDRLKYALIEGYHELYDSRSPGQSEHMLEVARVVDRYFLQGWLTRVQRRPCGRELSYLRIDIRDGNENCGGSRSSWRVRARDDGVGSPPVVDVDVDAAGAWTVGQVVAALIHEMVHGYLTLFSCRGGFSQEFGACSRRSHDTRGRHAWHSRTLLKHIYETIQGWEDTLGGFGEEFIEGCSPERRDEALADVRNLYS
ncbi:hypothetical protein LX36DRAFT_726896 [Colletotrichum falcatum]|nr:hypothetical protein LX36DRAFT_726896 [Colletotrichum falcatum]